MKHRSFRTLSALALFTVVCGLTGCGQSGSLTAPESPLVAGLNPTADGGEIPENPRLRNATRRRVSAMSAGDVARVAQRAGYSVSVPNVDPNGSLPDAVTYTNWRSGFFAWIESPTGARMSQVTVDLTNAITYVAGSGVTYPMTPSLSDLAYWAQFVGPDNGTLEWAMRATSPGTELKKLATYVSFLKFRSGPTVPQASDPTAPVA